ncbi:MAG: HAD-IB family phosphatase [Dehalococcoidia bacterium]|nr:HAD-IB family phosphatase [Dehalococcoidia bacterium]
MAAVLTLDFDDTIITGNLTRALFERFAEPAWRDHAAAYSRGEISVEQYNARAFDAVPVSVTREEIAAFAVAEAEVRPGFHELLDWAHWNDWLVVVVSNGLDIAVDAVLDHLGVERVARHAGRTRAGYRWRVRFYSPRGIEIEEGFKLAYASSLRATGDFVAYVGDGASDVDAARLAPVVFARDTLLARLKDERPRVYAFETFHDVIAVLNREAAGWLASFSSTTAAEG